MGTYVIRSITTTSNWPHQRPTPSGVSMALSSQGTSPAQTLMKLDSSRAITLNPSSKTVAGNQINLFTVGQNRGTLTITSSNGTSIAITGGDGKEALLGTNPTVKDNVLTGSAEANLTITSANDTLNFTYNGAQLSATLAPKTYTADELAKALQTAINGAILTEEGLTTGAEVVYHDSGVGSPIEGLVNGGSYFVIRTADNAIMLAGSLGDAQAGHAIALGPNLGAGKVIFCRFSLVRACSARRRHHGHRQQSDWLHV